MPLKQHTRTHTRTTSVMRLCGCVTVFGTQHRQAPCAPDSIPHQYFHIDDLHAHTRTHTTQYTHTHTEPYCSWSSSLSQKRIRLECSFCTRQHNTNTKTTDLWGSTTARAPHWRAAALPYLRLLLWPVPRRGRVLQVRLYTVWLYIYIYIYIYK
jgi:hypothetical protein